MAAEWVQRDGKRYIGSPVEFSYRRNSYRRSRYRTLYATAADGTEYELEWRRLVPNDTPCTGYHLYGAGYFGEFCGRRLAEAVEEANNIIAGGVHWYMNKE